MLNVENRTPYPGKEGRVRLRQDNGQIIEGVLEMADDATAPGTPWNRQSGRLLQADIRSYPVAAGQTITAGDVVDVIDSGYVGKVYSSNAPVEYNNLSTEVYAAKVGRFSKNKNIEVISYPGQKSWYLYDDNCNQIGNGRVDLTPSRAVSLVVLSDTVCVVGYTYANALYARVGVLSGNSVTFDDTATSIMPYTNIGDDSRLDIVNLGDNRLLFIATDTTYRIPAALVEVTSSNKFSLLSTNKFLEIPSAGTVSRIKGLCLPKEGASYAAAVFALSNKSGYAGECFKVLIDQSNDFSIVDEAVFDNTGKILDDMDAVLYDDEHVILAYSRGDGVIIKKLKIEDLSETSSNGPIRTVTTNSLKLFTVQSSIMVTYSSVNSFFRTIKGAGDTLDLGEEIAVYGHETKYVDFVETEPDTVFMCFSNPKNSSRGYISTLKVMGGQIAGSFLDVSKDAIALQSGTHGQSIEVIYSGTVYADWVTAGQVINSPGVYGVGVLDGVLQAWSSERPGQTIFGHYTGNSVTNSVQNLSVDLGFMPKAVIITGPPDLGASSSGIGFIMSFSDNHFGIYRTTNFYALGDIVTFTDTGFALNGTSAVMKYQGAVYSYMAWR